MSASEQPPLTDSPWFWTLLFAVVGVIALATIGGQYGKRQARLERQYQARERIQNDRIGDDAARDPARRDYSSPDRTLIPIWPLAVLLGGAIALSAVMLGREHHRRRHEWVPPVAPTGVAQPTEASERALQSEITTSENER